MEDPTYIVLDLVTLNCGILTGIDFNTVTEEEKIRISNEFLKLVSKGGCRQWKYVKKAIVS